MERTKTALVTGGARGIGREISKALSREGYRVVVHCNTSFEEAKELCGQLGNAETVCCDLSQPESVQKILELCPDPDVLINNAGVALTKPFDTVTAEESQSLYRINLFAPLELSRGVLPQMIRRKSGVIINISSVFGELGGSCEVDYSASKAGLIGFTKALAKEVGPSGVRVNCICPGAIDTDMNCELTPEELEALAEEIPLDRLGTAREVADSVVFLCSDSASYITGAVLDVNGGWY